MPWDKKYYNAIRKFVKYGLEHRPFQLGDRVTCPVEWAITFFPLITMSVQNEDWEAAQATKDAITSFLRKFGAKIPRSATLKIPDTYTEHKGGFHISMGNPDDPTGFSSTPYPV